MRLKNKIRIINQLLKNKKKEINKLDEDNKNLSKRLEQVQQSTRTIEHFDKRTI